MKIEVGKFYKTCAGEKVRIYAVDALGDYPVHGATFSGDRWTTSSWTLDGTWSISRPTPNSSNIVGEWVEPKPTMFAYYDEAGRTVVYMSDCAGPMLGNPRYRRAAHLDIPEET